MKKLSRNEAMAVVRNNQRDSDKKRALINEQQSIMNAAIARNKLAQNCNVKLRGKV